MHKCTTVQQIILEVRKYFIFSGYNNHNTKYCHEGNATTDRICSWLLLMIIQNTLFISVWYMQQQKDLWYEIQHSLIVSRDSAGKN